MHQLYQEYCYVDELKAFDSKLVRVLEENGVAFDEHYEYKLANPTSRQVAIRSPLGGDPKAEWGDSERDIKRQNRLPVRRRKGDSRIVQREL